MSEHPKAGKQPATKMTSLTYEQEALLEGAGPGFLAGCTRNIRLTCALKGTIDISAVRAALDPYPLSDLRIIAGAPHNLAVAESARTADLILQHLGLRPVEPPSSIEGA